jgi:hypothetical protein
MSCGIAAHNMRSRARICKRSWSPGIDSDGPITPAYVAWRAGTTYRVVVQARHAENRRLGSLQGLKIRAPAFLLNHFLPPALHTEPPRDFLFLSLKGLFVRQCFGIRAGIFKESMGARNRGRIGLSYLPARLHTLADLIPWNRFLGSINV